MTTLPRDDVTFPIRLFSYVPGDAITDALNALINDINTNFVPPGGLVPISLGGTGQSTANAAFNALSPLNTKGDIIGFSTVNARLPVGLNGEQLIADSAQTLGIKWNDIRKTANNWTETQSFLNVVDAIVLSTGNIIRQFSGGTDTGSVILFNVADGPTGRQRLAFTTDNTTFSRKEVTTLNITNDAGAVTVANGIEIVARATGFPPRIMAIGTDTDVGLRVAVKGTGTLSLESGSGNLQVKISNTGIGFYDGAVVAKPTGVAVTAAGIHAALVTLGLIAA
ncbi:MAG: hypothetical protein MN733_05135 [Nitrososphaera sp.]|nr:hypothetical protein [Nitrososphaera sp.]